MRTTLAVPLDLCMPYFRENFNEYSCRHSQTENERIMREKQLEQEERMARELARVNHEKLREEKLRQQIRENRYKEALGA